MDTGAHKESGIKRTMRKKVPPLKRLAFLLFLRTTNYRSSTLRCVVGEASPFTDAFDGAACQVGRRVIGVEIRVKYATGRRDVRHFAYFHQSPILAHPQ